MIDHSHLKNICGHPVIENIDKIKAIFAIRTDFMVAFLLLFDKFLSYSSLSICSIRLSKCLVSISRLASWVTCKSPYPIFLPAPKLFSFSKTTVPLLPNNSSHFFWEMLLFLIMYSVADLHIKIKFLSIKLYYQLTDCKHFKERIMKNMPKQKNRITKQTSNFLSHRAIRYTPKELEELRECAMILHKVEDAELRELYKKRDELHPENHLSNGDSLCQESERLALLFAVSLSLLSLILACLVLSYH